MSNKVKKEVKFEITDNYIFQLKGLWGFRANSDYKDDYSIPISIDFQKNYIRNIMNEDYINYFIFLNKDGFPDIDENGYLKVTIEFNQIEMLENKIFQLNNKLKEINSEIFQCEEELNRLLNG